MRFLTGIFLGGLLLAQSPAELTKVFDQYLAAVKANDFKKVTAVYQSSVKEMVLSQYGSAGDQKEFLAALAEMAPDSYEAPTATPSEGQKVLLRVLGKKKVPPAIRKEQKLPPVVQMPMVIEVAQEGGEWRMGPPSFGDSPPAKEPQRPKDGGADRLQRRRLHGIRRAHPAH